MLACSVAARRLLAVHSKTARQLVSRFLPAPHALPASPRPAADPAVRHTFGLTACRGSSARTFMASAASGFETELVEIDNGGKEELNFILGQAHFIKTVEDVAEALFGSGPSIKFGVAFCEASGDRKIRYDGNDEGLVSLATKNAQAIGAGHSFIIFLKDAYPVNVLKQVQACPTVARIFCATANPTAVVVGRQGERRGILGVLDGLCPVAVEDDADIADRKALLRAIGYKR